MVGPGEGLVPDRPPPRFLEDDRLLSALLEAGDQRSHGLKGSFGTVGGRRRRRGRKELVTRLLGQYPALLEDQSPGLVRLVLERSHLWDFSAFLLDRFSGGNSLSTLCLHLFQRFGLISHFGLDPADCSNFFKLVESGYHSGNPYHTALHAADVTQAIAVFVSQEQIARHLTRLELLAVITAAVCHDLDHPGVNEKFLVSTGSHLFYDNVTTLESHHWQMCLSCFVDSGLHKSLTPQEFAEYRDLVRDLILATDISRQQEFLEEFRKMNARNSRNSSDMCSDTSSRHFILQIALKCADISNPCRAWPVSRLWSLRCCEEFFRQGDAERELGLPLTPFCDRFNVTVAKLQKGFYTLLCEPLYKEWHRFLGSPLSEGMLHNLYRNQREWERELVQQEDIPAEVVKEKPVTVKPLAVQFLQAADGPRLTRRLSLPASDPLHRIFDQMIQPDVEPPRTGHLRRATSDRRRSSLLRGLHGRSSLKPLRGRVVRPASVCLEQTESSRLNRPLQNRENTENSMDISGDEACTALHNLPDLLQNKATGEKENSCLGSSYERLTRRRGSAPSNLVVGDGLRIPLTCGPPPGLLRQQNSLSPSNRRGSLPTDLLKESLPKQLRNRVIQPAGGGGKRPGLLLRRRSVGPEQLVQKYLNRPF